MRSVACIGEAMIELNDAGSGLLRRSYGGDTINVAIYARRSLPSGTGRVAYVTALGDDPLSEGMISSWREEGIDTSLVVRVPGRLPGLYMVQVGKNGERAFRYWRSAAPAREVFRLPETEAILAAVSGFDMLYVSGISFAVLDHAGRARLLEAMRRMRAADRQVAVDPNWRPQLWESPDEASRIMIQAMRCATLALPTFGDEADLFGDKQPADTIRRLHGLGVAEVVVKQGSEPAIVSWGAGIEEVPPIPVEEPVDTTAAGDSFNGAYIAARCRGFSPMEAAAEAHAMAAHVIMHPGAIVPRRMQS